MATFMNPYSTKRIYPPWFKRCVWSILCWRCRLTATFLQKLRPVTPSQNIVVLEPFGMGDVVALQPLVWVLCEEGKTVTAICREAWLPIFRPHPNLRTVSLRQDFAYRKHFRQAVKAIRRCHDTMRPATGIDPRGDIRSVLALWLSGICNRVETLECYFTANDCPIPHGAATAVHPVDRTVERYKVSQVFATLPLEPPTLGHLKQNAIATMQNGKTVGFITNTPWEGKRWRKWAELEMALKTRGWTVKYIECGSVGQWVAELPQSDVIVSVNTGPMHLAAALGIPLVVLEGSSRMPLWAPVSQRVTVIHHQHEVACAPCHQAGKCRRGHDCMERISVDETVEAVERMTVPLSRHST